MTTTIEQTATDQQGIHNELAPSPAEVFDAVIKQEGVEFYPTDPEHYGRADSAHAVMFGKLIPLGADDSEADRVAVKSFVGKNGRCLRRATNELRNTQLARQLGFRTLSARPELSILTAEDANLAFLITTYQEGLNPLHSLDWQVDKGSPEYDQRVDLLNRLAEFTADMHAAGAIHGDWQAKNAIEDDFGNFWITDLEKAQVSLKGLKVLNNARSQKHAARDVVMLVDSIINQGFMPKSHVGETYQVLVEEFVYPYLNRLCEKYNIKPEDLTDGEIGETSIPRKLIDIVDYELRDEVLRLHHGSPVHRKSSKAPWVDVEAI